MIKVTPEFLASVVAILISLGCSYIPSFNTWFAAQDGIYKRLINVGLTAVVAAVILGLSCAKLVPWVGCQADDIVSIVWIVIQSVIANQMMFLASPKTVAVKAVLKAKGA